MRPLKQAEAEDDPDARHSARTGDERLVRAEDDPDTLRTAGDEHQPRAADEPTEAAVEASVQEDEDKTAIDATDAIDNRQIKKKFLNVNCFKRIQIKSI